MNKPRISIIIPAYNEERHLVECLDSVASQSVSPFEVIVVDNNSTDATAAVASKYPFVTLLHEKQQGIIPARNAGFRMAKGDIIARIDGDTVLPTDWVMQVQQYLSDPMHDEYVGVTGSLYFFDKPLRPIHAFLHRLTYFGVARLVYRRQVFYGGSMAFRASALPDVWQSAHSGGSIHEDVDLALAMAKTGRVAYVSSLRVGVSFAGTVEGPKKMLRYLVTLISFWRY